MSQEHVLLEEEDETPKRRQKAPPEPEPKKARLPIPMILPGQLPANNRSAWFSKHFSIENLIPFIHLPIGEFVSVLGCRWGLRCVQKAIKAIGAIEGLDQWPYQSIATARVDECANEDEVKMSPNARKFFDLCKDKRWTYENLIPTETSVLVVAFNLTPKVISEVARKRDRLYRNKTRVFFRMCFPEPDSRTPGNAQMISPAWFKKHVSINALVPFFHYTIYEFMDILKMDVFRWYGCMNAIKLPQGFTWPYRRFADRQSMTRLHGNRARMTEAQQVFFKICKNKGWTHDNLTLTKENILASGFGLTSDDINEIEKRREKLYGDNEGAFFRKCFPKTGKEFVPDHLPISQAFIEPDTLAPVSATQEEWPVDFGDTEEWSLPFSI